MNYKNCCRTCLGSNKEMRHFQTVINIAGVNVLLTDILKTFYNFEITSKDSFPEYICINCVYHLTITYSFKVLIEKSSDVLEKCVGTIDSSSNDCSSDLSSIILFPTVYQRSTLKMVAQEKFSSIHDDERNQVFCVECKAKFESPKSLTEHCSANHPVKSSVGRDCDYCNEKFEDFRSLINHMKLHLKPYACDSCWEGFYNQSDLKSHLCKGNRRKKIPEKPLQQCEQCGKSYPSSYIKLHMRIHGNDTPYSCKYCPKKFKVRCSLNSHVLWKHNKTKNHVCDICNATFVSSSSRSSHVRKEHYNERKHVCVTCGKKFFQRCDMKRHYLTHTGIKKFHCQMCDKSYQRRYGLNVHLKSHSHVQHSHKTEKS